jgi:hypothetical protein
MKKIKAQEKKEQEQAPEMKVAAKFEVLPTKSSLTLFADVLSIVNDQQFSMLNIGTPVDQPTSIFHPPPAIC